MTACLATIVTLPSLVALIVLSFWTMTTNSNQNRNGEGEHRSWYDFDFRREEVENAKILLNLFMLTISCGTLLVPITKVSSGLYARYNVGTLAGSMYMFGNMLVVSFWYLLNFGVSCCCTKLFMRIISFH